MDDKETSLLQNPSLENGDRDLFPSSGHENQKVGSEIDETLQVLCDAGHLPKQVHHNFVKLRPTVPDPISKVRKLKRVIEIMNQEHLQISEKIKAKMSERDHLKYRLKHSNYSYRALGSSVASQGSMLNDLYVALDELCFTKKAPRRVSSKLSFKGKLDNHKLNFLMLRGSRTLAEEKQVLREISMIEQSDAASFSALDGLRHTSKQINWNYYADQCQNLLTEIKHFQLQREAAADNVAVKGKISNYASLKKSVKSQIKLMCDETLEQRRERMALSFEIKHIEKELEATNKVIFSLQKKLIEKYGKKAQVYQSILDLKKVLDGEV